MTKKQCWRYKCDFCKKVGYSSFHMKKHEVGCTANKDRICRMPVHADEPQTQSVQSLAGCLNSTMADYGMANLRKEANDCPACILAAIRHSGIQKWQYEDYEDGGTSRVDLKFNFKEELAAMWNDINSAVADERSHY